MKTFKIIMLVTKKLIACRAENVIDEGVDELDSISLTMCYQKNFYAKLAEYQIDENVDELHLISLLMYLLSKEVYSSYADLEKDGNTINLCFTTEPEGDMIT